MSLTPYRGKREPIRFGVYDLEWIPKTYEERLVGVRDEDGYRSYKTTTEFLESELVRRNTGKVFFAHAGGLADIQFVLQAFIARSNKKYHLEGSWSGSALIIVRVTNGKNGWTFADSFWLFRDSLDKIGKSIGLAKGGDDYFCPEWPACGHSDSLAKKRTCIFYAPFEILRRYNEIDCEILYRAIDRFQDSIIAMGGKMRLTIAANAMMLFRARYLKEEIPTCAILNRVARSAYIASRVEVFSRRCTTANYYDINSSFPHSMTHPVPGRFLGTKRAYKDGDCALIDATVWQPDSYLPAVPLRTSEGRIFFATGTFRRLMTNEDFELVIQTGGRIERVHKVYKFEAFSDLADYVEDVYALRKNEEDEFLKLLYKYLLNSLYGKFGEDTEKSALLVNPKKRPRCQGLEECARECQCITVYAPGVYKVKLQVEIAHANVPTSAAITARSRALLTLNLLDAKSRGNIHYCDTDSVVTKSLLSTSPELGAMKLEPVTIERGEFLSPKLYMLAPGKFDASSGKYETVVRSKGFRKLSVEEFDSLARGDSVAISRMIRIQENFASGCFSPREGEFEKHALSHFSASELKKLSADWDHKPRPMQPKRCMQDNGEDSRPWRVSELERS